MTFGVPSTAGAAAGATNPATVVGRGDQTLAAPGNSFDVVADVSAYTGIIVSAVNQGSVGGAVISVTYFDPAVTFSLDVLGSYLYDARGVPAVYWRNTGPFVRVRITNAGAATRHIISVIGTNTPGRFDGPYTPTASGVILASSLIAATTLLTIYSGPAILMVRNSNGVGAVTGLVRTASTTHTVAAGDQPAGVGPSATSSTVQCWIPPEPTNLITAVAGGGTVEAVLTSA